MKFASSEATTSTPAGASRRGFLGLLGGAFVAVGASVAAKSANATPITGAAVFTEASDAPALASSSRVFSGGRGIFSMPDHLSLDAFKAQLDTPFHVPDADVSLQLVKATDTSRGDNVHSFQLVLVGPLEPVLSPDTHLLRHATMGDMALFISPFKQDENGTRYHVSFSHLLD